MERFLENGPSLGGQDEGPGPLLPPGAETSDEHPTLVRCRLFLILLSRFGYLQEHNHRVTPEVAFACDENAGCSPALLKKR